MKSRWLLPFCLALASLPAHAAEEQVKQAQNGWLKRAASIVWPFKKKSPSEGGKATKTTEPGKSWRHLSPSITLEPVPLKLSEGRTVKVTLRVLNRGNKLVELDFPTSQRIEVLVKDRNGKMIEQWSEDQAFQNEPSLLTINPNERLEYSVTVSARDFKPGEPYTVEGFFPNFNQIRASKQIVPEP